ncbi:MAG: energy-coupling factor ABC transporter ATP-binding protein [Desulfarculaceae bacterium]|nr:energy-coupling factor ABC transporter ATP-binding protein [Desulfarculaceae bacterium]MCF8074135.1 energy-coupling factor ABC transporter ATP-binding protein [Desulfarculaceae bacterium]MCF8103273.1 energy-coupling factor ABC transporter ATP-binding protein [Desulfarculaceae bacterium]MCF8116869.1 energy-coupling factor ABC transporter ATP-binding protein [Desulfarculaceae bacterium]
MELIELREVSFAYDGRPPVLEKASFSLSPGQRTGIVGPNGAGKSTLFLIAMGLLKPQSGTVRGLGRECREEKDFRPLRAAVGFCFQDPDDQLFSLTVREDVAFGPLNLGRTRAEALAIVSQTLESLGLAGFEERVTYHLSGGERRMVSLATVLAMRPQALLLDEPTAGLDTGTQQRLEQVLLASGLAWAVVSHDRGFLERTCDSILRLEQGRLEPV